MNLEIVSSGFFLAGDKLEQLTSDIITRIDLGLTESRGL